LIRVFGMIKRFIHRFRRFRRLKSKNLRNLRNLWINLLIIPNTRIKDRVSNISQNLGQDHSHR
jgi:hypothetical protein